MGVKRPLSFMNTNPNYFILPAVIGILCAQTGQAGDANSTFTETPALLPVLAATQRSEAAGGDDKGDILHPGAREAGMSLGAALGLKIVTGHINHNLAIGSVRYGEVLGDTVGTSHWYCGHWELIGELFAGGQYDPKPAYVVGVTPLLRYNFTTGTRWLPFVQGGFGPSVTDIGQPDLGTAFEFNIQGGAGVHYFWNQHSAITVECRYFHLSNADIRPPNQGVNACVFSIGNSWLF